MKKQDIDHFFLTLDQKIARPVEIILTGGGACLLLGGSRPTLDLDFAIKTSIAPADFNRLIDETETQTGIKAQYAEDIDRWSMISFLDYQAHTRLFKKYRHLKVKLMSAEHLSIGKITRYYDSDISDLIAVFKKQKTKSKDVIDLWSRALIKSPLSEVQGHFKKHAIHFLKTHGPTIWGKRFKAQDAIKSFEEKIIQMTKPRPGGGRRRRRG